MTTPEYCPKCGAGGLDGKNRWSCGNELVGGTNHRTKLCILNESVKAYMQSKTKANTERLKGSIL